MTDSEHLRQGLETLAALDPSAFESMQAGLGTLAPGLPEAIVEFGFGAIASRPGLDLKQRELVSVAAVATLGGAQPQLTAHLVYALKLGWTREELTEAIIQLAPLSGVPRVINGLLALAEAAATLEGAAA